MNILCIIPARGGSKRLKNKNVIRLLGKPIIGYTIEAAFKSKLINKIIISTDDAKIMNVAKKYKVQTIKRPKKYSTDSAPIEEALRHSIRYLKSKENYIPDIVVFLHANVPIRKKGQIDRVIKKIINTKADSVVTVCEANRGLYWTKSMDKNGFLCPLFPKINKFRSQDFKPMYLLDGAVAAIKPKVLMKSAHKRGVHLYMGKKILGIIEDKKYAIEIDEKEDLELVKFYMRKRKVA